MAPFRVVFFGTPGFAVPTLREILAAGHEVAAVVTQPDRPRGRGQKPTPGPVKAFAEDHGLEVLQPERVRDEPFLAAIASLAPDLGVVAAFGRILPAALLAIPRLGMINVHASLLPRHRGAAPVHRAVMAGDAETGVSIMRVVQALDAGGVFATATRPIGPDDTSAEVERDLARMGAALVVEVLDALAAGTAVEVPQDDTLATYAHRLSKEEGLIDWRRPATVIHNQVRGLQPWPMTWTHLGGRRLIIVRTRLVPGEGDAVHEPGSIVEVGRDAFTVQTGSGLLDVLSVQPEGRRVMPARDFAAGHLGAGARFDDPPVTPAGAPGAGPS